MDDTLLQTLAVCAVFALIFGPLTARSSHRHKPVSGGVVGHAFHLIASMAFVAVLPGALGALILGGGFEVAFPVIIGLVIVIFVSLLGYAAVENNAA